MLRYDFLILYFSSEGGKRTDRLHYLIRPTGRRKVVQRRPTNELCCAKITEMLRVKNKIEKLKILLNRTYARR